VTAGALLSALIERHVSVTSPFHSGLSLIAESGNLAERLTQRLPRVDRPGLFATYQELADCLRKGEPFLP
jgi:hypothetical protein